MNAEVLFQAIEAAAVVVGVAFAVYETRRYRGERNREAAMELLHAFQTPEFAKALVLVYRLPDGLSKQQIESSLGEDLHRVYAMTTTWESIGVLVFRGEVSIDLVDDFFSGPIVVSWRKLQSYFFDERRETGRETVGELVSVAGGAVCGARKRNSPSARPRPASGLAASLRRPRALRPRAALDQAFSSGRLGILFFTMI